MHTHRLRTTQRAARRHALSGLPGLLVLLAAVAIAAPAAAASPRADTPRALGAPWALLPWGDAGPGLVRSGEERQATGPTAIAGVDGAVWIADAAHERLLRVGPGGVEAALPLGFAPADVRVTGDGRPFVLSADLQTIGVVGASGVRRERVPAAISRPRALAVAPDGAAWAVDASGFAAPVIAAPPLDGPRAEPLGARHGVGRVDGPHAGRVLLWSWADAAELKRVPPAEILVQTALPLGLVRPLAAHAGGGVTVLLEQLASTAPVAVTAEVRRLDASGATLGAVSFPLSGVAPASRYVDVAADGTLWIMQPQQAGLAVWRLAPAEWTTGGAR